MYDLDFNSPETMAFPKDKKENILSLYHAMQRKYDELNNKNTEIALIFKGTKYPSLFKTDRRNIVTVPGGAYSGSVKIGPTIERIVQSNDKRGNFSLAIFHNHCDGTGFSTQDMRSFVLYDIVEEAYLDSAGSVYYIKRLACPSYGRIEKEKFIKSYTDNVKFLLEKNKKETEKLNRLIINQISCIEEYNSFLYAIIKEALFNARKESNVDIGVRMVAIEKKQAFFKF